MTILLLGLGSGARHLLAPVLRGSDNRVIGGVVRMRFIQGGCCNIALGAKSKISDY